MTFALYFDAQVIIHSFKAASLSDAQAVAQSVSTLFAIPIRLLPHAAPAPAGQLEYDYAPSTQGTTVLCPSAVTGFAQTNT